MNNDEYQKTLVAITDKTYDMIIGMHEGLKGDAFEDFITIIANVTRRFLRERIKGMAIEDAKGLAHSVGLFMFAGCMGDNHPIMEMVAD